MVQVEWAFVHNRWLKGPKSITLSRGSDNREVRVRLWSRDNKPFTFGKVVSEVPQVERAGRVSGARIISGCRSFLLHADGEGQRLLERVY